MIEVKVPLLPESITDGTVAAWHKKAGDVVKRDEVLVEIETDKVVLEVPSEVNGVIDKIVEGEGSVVTSQQVLAYVEEKEVSSDNEPNETKPKSDNNKDELPAKGSSAAKTVDKDTVKSESVIASPSARQAIRDTGVDAAKIKGTGKGGRILKEDVINQSESDEQSTATVKPIKSIPGERLEERVPMSRLRKTVANRLLSATQQTAMLTTFNELDMSAVITMRNQHKEAFEQTHGVKLGFMSFFIKASIEALKKFPAVNAYIDRDDIVYHAYCDVSVAISSNRGLVVPVIKNAHLMSFAQIESEILNFANKAQSGKLSLDEMTGGTFTISNGGVFGSMLSTPIINPPQTAILGMHKTQERAVVIDGEIVIRPMMYLALSYDHRIIDGKEAVMFLRTIKENLEEPNRLLLNL